MKSEDVPELTRISSKGQVVIPSRVRKKLGIEAGSVFAILTPRKGNVVVLKRIDSKPLQADLRIFREVEKAWREIERGQAGRASRKRFLEELETW
jgi:AbrB family looped-hinge helix DNA binding protein